MGSALVSLVRGTATLLPTRSTRLGPRASPGVPRGPGVQRRLVEEAAGVVVGPQQRLDPLPQRPLLGTGLLQVGGTGCRRWLFHRRQEDGLHALGIKGHGRLLHPAPPAMRYRWAEPSKKGKIWARLPARVHGQ